MKFNLFKSWKKSPKRGGSSTKTTTSRASSRSRAGKKTRRPGGMPEWGKGLLKIGFPLLIVAVVIAGLTFAFHMYYCKSTTLFVVKDTEANIIIDTGRTVTPDLVKMFLGIEEGVNLFSINVNEKRDELLQKAPSIKDISIKRYMPDRLVISIIEREPVARVGMDGQVVDDEGVVFARSSRDACTLPVICKTKIRGKQKKSVPGDKLQGMDMAAVRLAASTFRPDCKSRLHYIDTSKSRYLHLIFPDGREARIAWDDMDKSTVSARKKMILQFDRLIDCMATDVGKLHHLWDAQHPKRIYARPTGFVE